MYSSENLCFFDLEELDYDEVYKGAETVNCTVYVGGIPNQVTGMTHLLATIMIQLCIALNKVLHLCQKVPQLVLTCLNSTMETPQQYVKCNQS